MMRYATEYLFIDFGLCWMVLCHDIDVCVSRRKCLVPLPVGKYVSRKNTCSSTGTAPRRQKFLAVLPYSLASTSTDTLELELATGRVRTVLR